MRIRIAGLEKNSIVDGEGIRYAIFCQGCARHCQGCQNPQTWNFSGGSLIDTSEIIREILEDPLLDGITFSGGEPFEQAEACFEIANAVKSPDLDVWTYTGNTLEEILNRNDESQLKLLRITDVLIDGEFIESQKDPTLEFRGSRNQRIIRSLDFFNRA